MSSAVGGDSAHPRHTRPSPSAAEEDECAEGRTHGTAEFFTLERVHDGGTVFDPEVVRRFLARTRHTDDLDLLTDRERIVLTLMAQGCTNAAIAQQLFISRSAVEKHTNAVFDKLRLPRDDRWELDQLWQGPSEMSCCKPRFERFDKSDACAAPAA